MNLPTILAVDDSEQILQVLDEVLRSQGFEVHTASSVERAKESLKSARPDLILCDIMMPEVDGFRFHSELKSNPDWCEIPFLFVSALSDPEEVRFGKELGCDDYVTKPFDPNDLAATIRGKLSVAKLRREKQKQDAEKFRKRVIHTLSHEFRTPLVAINTGTELLLEQREQLEADRLERLLESIQRGGLRLQRLVEDFMTIQQIDSGTAASIASRFKRSSSLSKIIELAIDSFQEQLRGEPCQIEFEKLVDEPVAAHVYDVQIVNVVQRLLSNAHKFGGADKLITVRIGSTPESISVFVRDRGPGMSTEAVRDACELFTQINRDRIEQQGCGLGLTISQYFSVLNGGKLYFSTPTDGAGGLEVELRFPRVS